MKFLASAGMVALFFTLVSAGCRNGDEFCGKCNGTSCKVAGLNYHCSSTTTCVGKGGGDGAYCGSSDELQGPYKCPLKK